MLSDIFITIKVKKRFEVARISYTESIIKFLSTVLPMNFFKGEDLREGNSPSWFNPVEAVQVVKYLQSLRSDNNFPLKLTDIGVITPYRKQVRAVKP